PPATPLTGPALTMDQVVEQALSNNSTVIIARERLRKAQEQIQQARAQALPQVSISFADTLSSQKSFGAAAGAVGTSASLPGGGVIPVIVDQGGGATGTFVGGGGGG